MNSYDYIIVGAGTAGCVLANRLSADAANKVLVLEAGGDERSASVAMPLAWFKAFMDPKLGWGYATEPEPYCDGRSLMVPRGKLIGGCSSINGMMYSRGHAADYDRWERGGLPGWGYADVLPYFKVSEANWRGESLYHGASGPLSVVKHDTDNYIYPRLIKAGEQLGHVHLNDFHGDTQEGFSAPDFTIHRGRRGSTAALFLRPALERPNLNIVTGALTTRVLIEQGRAIGVEYRHEGQLLRAMASREVVLSGGAYNSPQLLMLSGIGPADHLRETGIPVVHDLPGVGANLQEHASIASLYNASGEFTFDRALRLDRMTLAVLRWYALGTGPVAGLPVGAMGFLKSAPGLALPDLQTLINPVAMDSSLWFPGWKKRRGDVISVSNVLLRPASRGWVKLRSADPGDKPRIQFNLLQEESDRLALRRFVKLTREYFATPAGAALVRQEVMPGAPVQSDAEIDAFVRANVRTAMHPTSSCAMGCGPDAVLDASLQVRGLAGLRVVDASSMPDIIGGNTNAPTIMIAEKAADMMLGRALPRAVLPTHVDPVPSVALRSA
jgi:choline dehydrogenase